MNSVQRFALDHPVGIGLLFAICAGWFGYSAFRGGVSYARLVAATAQEASEALGG
jgi:hypothetical protein